MRAYIKGKKTVFKNNCLSHFCLLHITGFPSRLNSVDLTCMFFFFSNL